MTHPLVRRPNYVVFSPLGEIEELYCKICGSAIAGTREVSKGKHFDKKSGGWIETKVVKFIHFPNYTEAAIALKGGGRHITNGCDKCLNENMEADLIQAIHDADMDVEIAGGNKHAERMKLREAVMIVAIKPGGGIP